MIFFSAGSSNEFTSRETYISERNKSKLLSIMFHTDNSFKESLIVSTKLNCDILNIKVRQKYYTTYIIHNVICRPHWLKLFSNWSKYNAKSSLNTKWRQISMGWFNFFEQRVPRICLNKVLIVSVQLFLLSKPDNRYINLQQVFILNGEKFGL